MFEYDAIKAAHRTAALIRNPKGKKMNVNLDTLVVSKGYANHFRAIEILGALRKGWQPATADNEGPGVAEYKIVATPWITTNTDYWWMFDSTMKGPKYGLQYKESQPIQLEGPNIVFRTGEIQLANALAELKLSLINGENLEAGNAQQAEISAVATTKRERLFKRVCNSLNTAYNLIIKAVSWTEMFQPILTL